MAQSIATGMAVSRSNEADLVARAQQGDQAAFEALVLPRLDRLMRLAYSIVSNDADASDAVQEACILAWREIPRLRVPDRFEAWLWQIAINACRTALRSRRRVNVREITVEALPVGFDLPEPGRGLGDDLSASDLIQRAF